MKHLKDYKLFETGEWQGTRTLSSIKNEKDVDSHDECGNWILSMRDTLEDINELIDEGITFKIVNIIGFDMYQGPYAIVLINNKQYKIWYSEEPNLWIDNYKIDNTSQYGKNPGFEGDYYEIAEIINDTERLYTVKGQLDIIENHPEEIGKIIDKILPQVMKKHPHFKTGSDLNLT